MSAGPRQGKVGVWLLLLLGLAAGVVYFFPQYVRLGGQTQPPVTVSVRNSLLGMGRVLRLSVQGDKPLRNVQVKAVNSGHNANASYRFAVINPRVTEELGWREWNWSIDVGETITVSADGYALPITFTSAQLGVK